MTIFRTEHKRNYTCVNNFIATDKRLSYKGKGIWLYAFSRPDDWSFNLEDLINQSTDGKDSVSAGLRELENAGYLVRSRLRDGQGKLLKGAEWVFYETPRPKECSLGMFEPKMENPILENPILENPPLLSTKTIPSPETTQPSTENNNKAAVVVPQKSGCFVKDDIYFAREKLAKDWEDAEIEAAYKAFYPSRESVTDPLKYIEGIINKKRILNSQKDTPCQKSQAKSTSYDTSKKSLETVKQHSSENVIGEPLLANLSYLHKMRVKLGIS